MSEFQPMTDLKNFPAFDRVRFEHAKLKMMVMWGQKSDLDIYLKKHPIPDELRKKLAELASVYPNNEGIIALLNKKESKQKTPRNKG